uniref:Uncharacterized protein n=1 Tax=Junco hyemalis TaxID=40217 RepID=A0A8C5IJD9_JUNHY
NSVYSWSPGPHLCSSQEFQAFQTPCFPAPRPGMAPLFLKQILFKKSRCQRVNIFPASLNALPAFLNPQIPEFLHPSVPAFLNPQIPEFLHPSVPAFLNPQIPEFLHPSIPASFHPCIPSSRGCRALPGTQGGSTSQDTALIHRDFLP